MTADHTHLIVGDLHAPAVHRKAFPALCRLIEKVRPDVLTQVGDACDFHSVSQHPKTFGKERNFAQELRSAKAVTRELWDAGRRCSRRIAIQGNHEESFERYVARNAPALEELVPSARDLIALPDGVEWVPFRSHVEVGRTLVTHALRSSLDASARAAAARCVAYGHTHQAGIRYFGDVEGSTRFVLNVGWVGDREELQRIYARSIDMTNFQLGFGWIRSTRAGDWATFVPWVNGQYVLEGNSYR